MPEGSNNGSLRDVKNKQNKYTFFMSKTGKIILWIVVVVIVVGGIWWWMATARLRRKYCCGNNNNNAATSTNFKPCPALHQLPIRRAIRISPSIRI